MESDHDAFRDCQEDQQLIDDVYFKNHLWAYAAAMPGDEGDDVHPENVIYSLQSLIDSTFVGVCNQVQL